MPRRRESKLSATKSRKAKKMDDFTPLQNRSDGVDEDNDDNITPLLTKRGGSDSEDDSESESNDEGDDSIPPLVRRGGRDSDNNISDEEEDDGRPDDSAYGSLLCNVPQRRKNKLSDSKRRKFKSITKPKSFTKPEATTEADVKPAFDVKNPPRHMNDGGVSMTVTSVRVQPYLRN